MLIERRIAVLTRPEADCRDLARALEKRGWRVLVYPTVAIRPVPVPPDWDLSGCAWVIFTSANAAEIFFRLMKTAGRSWPRGVRAAAVGPRTADRIRAHGVSVDRVPRKASVAGLIGAFPPPARLGEALLFPCGSLAGPDLARGLAAKGYDVRPVEIYRTEPPPDLKPLAGPADLLVFASPSAARNFFAVNPPPVRGRVVSIGPATSRALSALGVPVDAEARTPSSEGILEVIP